MDWKILRKWKESFHFCPIHEKMAKIPENPKNFCQGFPLKVGRIHQFINSYQQLSTVFPELSTV